MRAIRTVMWMALSAIVVAFIIINWQNKVQINFWIDMDGRPLGFTWPVSLIAIVSFLLGMLPMWLLHTGTRWRLSRQISA